MTDTPTRVLELRPPEPERLVGWARMGERERAKAVLISFRHHFPFARAHVGYDPVTDVVVVEAPEVAWLFACVGGELSDVLAEIDRVGCRSYWEAEAR